MKGSSLLLLLVLLAPVTNATAQATDPLSVFTAAIAAQNSGDVAGATALYADDAVIINTRGRKFSGKGAIRQFIQGNVNARIHFELLNPHVVGDAATIILWERTDFEVRLGVAPVEIRIRAVVQGGRIKSVTAYYQPESLARVRRACDTPQAQGLLLFGQSCSEYVRLAIAQTRSVAASLKPFSAETDYKSLQNYLSPLR